MGSWAFSQSSKTHKTPRAVRMLPAITTNHFCGFTVLNKNPMKRAVHRRNPGESTEGRRQKGPPEREGIFPIARPAQRRLPPDSLCAAEFRCTRPIESKKNDGQAGQKGHKPRTGGSERPQVVAESREANAMPTASQIAALTWSLLNLGHRKRNHTLHSFRKPRLRINVPTSSFILTKCLAKSCGPR